MKKIYTIFILTIIASPLFAQLNWTDIREADFEDRRINPSKARLLEADFDQIQSLLLDAPMENTMHPASSPVVLEIPMPDGSLARFGILEAPVMAPELTAKYPMIRSFLGQGLDDKMMSIRCDIGVKGFHAVIYNSPEGTVYVDPISRSSVDHYQVYTRKAFFETCDKVWSEEAPIVNPDMEIDFDKYEEAIGTDGTKKLKKKVKMMGMPNPIAKATPTGTQLRTYRLALACTGEYATYHGGTVPLTLSAMNTSMTRVNGVYERELAIRMIIIGNNDQIIFLNGATDPYDNNNGGAMLNQNQTEIDNTIGSANYDIGHVYSTGGGGIAQLNSPCGSGKARGVTGQGIPEGDPFDIDYVCHEMGHQFGGNHTQNNSCNRSAGAAFEPGSASTIMGYAGICAPNLQSNSDDYFHNHSYNEMVNFSQFGNGNTCASISNTGNSVPTVSIPSGGWTIPVNTPFELTASGNDADGDPLTFNWEQYDLGPATSGGSLATASGTQPIFRSWPATTSPTRVFPRITDLVNNTIVTGELLPYYTRSMTFRCTVRDNRAGGGGLNDAQLSFNVSDQAGPFVVNSPNTNVTWAGNSTQTVVWDVANTDAAPINCSNVDIYLSVDGGLTYPILLLSGTANDGSAQVFIPDNETNTARIKVKGAGNIFFDISNTNFTIGPAVGQNDNDAGVASIAAPSGDICGDAFTPEFTILNQGALNLTSVTINWDVDGATPTTINWTGNLAPGGTETITLPAQTAATGSHTFNVALSNPNGVTDDNPTNDNSSSAFTTQSGGQEITYTLLTDCYPGETGWTLQTDGGTVIDQAATGSLAGVTTYNNTYCLTTGCYELIITDTFGDGLNGSAFACDNDGDYSVTAADGTVLVQMAVADFDNQANEPFCVTGDINGCTNAGACNYNPSATVDDGSCEFTSCAGCTNNTACNFDASATIDDGSCEFTSCAGCTDNTACNFDNTATIDDGSCEFTSCAGCTNAAACNYDPTASIDDGSCDLPDGCTNAAACNFDPTASCDDGSCEFTSCAGCTDAGACNYDMTATIDDGSCEFVSCAGCTDSGACNYDASATIDNGTCEFTSCAGCTNATACNYDATATIDDGSCDLPDGCTDNTACNYDPAASCDDGSCEFTSCLCPGDFNNDTVIDVQDLLYFLSEYGCTSNCVADLNDDGTVNGGDLLNFLSLFGTTCN